MRNAIKTGIVIPPPPSKTAVGLGNVPNVDTTNASNITTGVLPDTVMPPVAVNMSDDEKLIISMGGMI